MTNIARNTRLQIMASCWSAAVDLGFSLQPDTRGPLPGGYAHQSGLLYLVELDPETTWEIALFEIHDSAIASGRRVHRETGRVRLTCVSVCQFQLILSGLVAQV